MKKLLITFILIVSANFGIACLNTYQFKIFPVGQINDKIVTIDIKVWRTSQLEGSGQFKLKINNSDSEFTVMWIIDSYISTYSKQQNLINNSKFRSTYSIGDSYLDTLNGVYKRGIELIKRRFKNIELFTPEYISFCDFQKSCEKVSLVTDTLNKKLYLKYDNQSFPLDILNDSTFYGIKKIEEPSIYYLSSVRIYKSKTSAIIVVHLETGHEISMGWISDKPRKYPPLEEETVFESKETKPDFPFNNINNCVFKEPLLHHGYGFDLIIIK